MDLNKLNTDFFARTKNYTSEFEEGGVNYYKIVHDSLIRKLTFVSKGISNKLFLPPLFLKLLFILKSFKSKKDSGLFVRKKSSDLVVSNTRLSDGKHVYLERILPHITENNPTVVNLNNVEQYDEADFTRRDIQEFYGNQLLDSASLSLLQDLKRLYSRLQSLGIFSKEELNFILVGINEFWLNADVWRRFFEANSFKRLFIIPGYQTEAILYGAKKASVEIVELQHGIISNYSNFYIYPDFVSQIRDQALFPDKVFVFGEFWKKRLASGGEYDDYQIAILGDYFYKSSKKSRERIIDNKKSIIFAGQKPVDLEFQKSYLVFLKNEIRKRKLDYVIYHKPHPLEQVDDYEDVYDEILRTTDVDIATLFDSSDIFISMFSTTLYEARQAGLKVYSLYYDDFGYYTDELDCSNVAKKIEVHQFPMDIPFDKERFPSDYFFSKFDASILKTKR